MIGNKLIFFVFILFCEISVFSQETIIPRLSNPELQGQTIAVKQLKSAASINLPFFDDFSNISDKYPNQKLWIDKVVYINANYGKDPISIGVATFDALDQNGNLYSNKQQPSFRADSLTSNPINLNFPNEKSIFLSFYYQAGGFGEMPDINDSLILQFYAPSQKKWHTVWPDTTYKYKPQIESQPFKLVMINITDSVYLKESFQFRFINYASLVIGKTPAEKYAKSDIWNIDYVYLNKGRSADDTVMNDASIVYPLKSLLVDYECMPWSHFVAENTFRFMGDQTSLTVKNNYSDTLGNSIFHKYDIMEVKSGQRFSELPENREQFIPFETKELKDNVRSFYSVSSPENIKDGADFKIKVYIETPDSVYKKVNDTTEYHQLFGNYYAYDDSSAEYGYGIENNNTMIACQYDMGIRDTIQSVSIYFNHPIPYSLNASEEPPGKNFYLCIWKDKNGMPDTAAIYRDSTQMFPDKWGWKTIDIQKTIVLSGIFYIGIQQTSSYFANIGYDVNRVQNNKVFFSTGSYIGPDGKSGLWEKSNSKKSMKGGSLMIRPIIGKWKGSLKSAVQKEAENIDVYPNPTSDFINIRMQNLQNNAYYKVFDFTGRVWLHNKYTGKDINIQNLPRGMYLLKLQNEKGEVFNSKFIKK
jgi:hypothetical protein